ncbi:MAG: hypothetical protein ACE149_12750 [Armatimonadota bacterium]
MQARRRDVKPAKPAWQLPRSVQKALEHVILVSAFGAVASLVYLLFVIMSGGLAAQLIAGTALEQVTRNLGLAKGAFLWCLWVLMLATMVRHYKVESTGLAAMLAGAACWAVLPLIVRSRIDSTSAQELLQLGQSLITSFQTTGGGLVVVGFLRFGIGRVILLASPARAAARFMIGSPDAGAIAAERALEKPSLMRKCYELHLCRTGLRTNCPRFLEGASCWKKKSGCYCDQNLATQLLTGISANARAAVTEELQAAQRRTRIQTKRQRQKASCSECPIYLEHQKHKYRVISWLSYPAAAAIIGATVTYIQYGYEWVEYKLGDFLAGFQLLPHRLSDAPLQQVQWISAENAAVLLIGVLLVGLILQLTELAIFRVKL